MYYRITMRGDGLVTLEDLGWGDRRPQQAARTRHINEDEFVAVLNQLLKARFLDAIADYRGGPVAQLRGDHLSSTEAEERARRGWS